MTHSQGIANTNSLISKKANYGGREGSAAKAAAHNAAYVAAYHNQAAVKLRQAAATLHSAATSVK